jgi:hypothetical protein
MSFSFGQQNRWASKGIRVMPGLVLNTKILPRVCRPWLGAGGAMSAAQAETGKKKQVLRRQKAFSNNSWLKDELTEGLI